MRLQGKNGVKHLAMLAMLSAIAIICGYIEFLIPFSFGIPGVKLGLANAVTVMILCIGRYRGRRVLIHDAMNALIVMIVRVVVIGMLFSNVYSILYSLSGGLISLLTMWFFTRSEKIGTAGISVIGGIMHNLGQLLVAALIVEQLKIAYYAPILLLAGTITGFLIGILSDLILRRRGVQTVYDRFFER